MTQNRIAEKSFINDHGIATAPWRAVNSRADLQAALDEIGYPAVLKTCEGGYDGHGQIVLRSAADLERVWADDGFPPAILEGFVDFAFEASILVSGDGERYVTFPIVRNVHRNNILHMTIAPAEVPDEVAARAHELARTLADGFKLAGTLAIELFVTRDGRVLVNELAPRPHNSGHYTIEACSIDQFDAHIRGIAGWPLAAAQAAQPGGDGQRTRPACGTRPRALIGEHPEWNVHDYGKAQVKQGPQDGSHHRADR